MKKFASIALSLAIIPTLALAASTFTTYYNLEKPNDGSEDWAPAIRDGLDTIDLQMHLNAQSITDHVNDMTGAHAASAIEAMPGSTICQTVDDAQEFLTCLADNIGAVLTGGVVTIAGNETITGQKEFTQSIIATGGVQGDLTGNVTGNVTGDLTGNVTGNVTGDVTGSLIGNADTATALVSNPADCSAGNLAESIAANGDLTCAQVTNSYVAPGAAIDYSKLALTGSIVNADVSNSAAIAYSKLALTGSVVNGDLASVSSQTFKGRTTGGSGSPEDLNATQATAILNNFVGDSGAGGTKGLVPAPAAGDAAANKYLFADGTWQPTAAARTSSLNALNIGVAATVGSNALTIALKQSDGTSDPAAGAAAVQVGFRSSTLTSGSYNQRSVTGALSVVVSSGSTLGTTNGGSFRIYVYAIDNAGTVELAVSRTLFNEAYTYNTTAEGGAGAADSDSIIYSTTARTAVPIRLIGQLTSTQTTAGTWATSIPVISVPPFDDARVSTGGGAYDVYAANITSGCSLTDQSASWVSSVTNNGSSNCTVNIISSAFASTPYCSCTGYRSGGGRVICSIDTATTPSATAIRIFLYDEGGTPTGNGAYLTCFGKRR